MTSYLFANGTEHDIWEERNCERCIKGGLLPGSDYAYACPIREAIAMAGIGEPMPDDLAARGGLVGRKPGEIGRCTELALTPEALAKAAQQARDAETGMDALKALAWAVRKIERQLADTGEFLQERTDAMLEAGAAALGPDDDPMDACTDTTLLLQSVAIDGLRRDMEQLAPLFAKLQAKLEAGQA